MHLVKCRVPFYLIQDGGKAWKTQFSSRKSPMESIFLVFSTATEDPKSPDTSPTISLSSSKKTPFSNLKITQRHSARSSEKSMMLLKAQRERKNYRLSAKD
jgi:hypothetical protein